MPEKNDHTLREVIEQLLRAYKWDEGLDEARLINAWEQIAGRIIAKHTTKLKIKERTLYVHVDSSVIRNELMMSRSTLIEKINREMGTRIIEKIVLR